MNDHLSYTKHLLVVSEEESAELPRRVDAYVASQIPELTRSQIDLATTTIKVNSAPVKKSHKIRTGDVIEIETASQMFDLEPENIPLTVLYENSHVVVIDKPQGMVVHPAAGNWSGTLVHGLLFRFREMQNMSSERPGIVHRLDKDTSGTIIVAKDVRTVEFLAAQFAARSVQKVYIAIVKGTPLRRRGVIRTQIVRDRRERKRFTTSENEQVGKYAETQYLVLKQYKGYALVRLTLKTGRTHQLRVHMKHIGHPIVGDPIYSRRDPLFTDAKLQLHAFSLTIDIPSNHDGIDAVERRCFRSPLPERFKKILYDVRIAPVSSPR